MFASRHNRHRSIETLSQGCPQGQVVLHRVLRGQDDGGYRQVRDGRHWQIYSLGRLRYYVLVRFRVIVVIKSEL